MYTRINPGVMSRVKRKSGLPAFPESCSPSNALLESKLLNTQLECAEPSSSPYQKQIVSLQLITILWMCVEAAIALFTALRAHSVVLLGFGADSGIELMSAFVVFLRFRRVTYINEKKASRITGLLLFALAAFILGGSIVAFINPRFRPEPSYLGIGLLIAAGFFMPWLATQKRELATRANSGALKADAVQSSLCAYLAWIALSGLVVNAIFKISWADPVAALLLLPIILREGLEAMQGKSCSDCAC
jgi:Co/Zn/Cd efflux system component